VADDKGACSTGMHRRGGVSREPGGSGRDAGGHADPELQREAARHGGPLGPRPVRRRQCHALAGPPRRLRGDALPNGLLVNSWNSQRLGQHPSPHKKFGPPVRSGGSFVTTYARTVLVYGWDENAFVPTQPSAVLASKYECRFVLPRPARIAPRRGPCILGRNWQGRGA